MAQREVEKEMIRKLANPGPGDVRQKIHSHTQPCLESEVRQERVNEQDPFNVVTNIRTNGH